jgi:hypothetical protein
MARLNDLHAPNHLCHGECVKVVPYEDYERLRAALKGTVELICEIDWTAFSLADRAKLDTARKLLGSAFEESNE